jgi:acyl-CoA synthetase (AMP-forming)/AMP-acid ligase II
VPLAARLADFAATGLPFLPILALLLISPTWGLSGENEWSLSDKLEGLYFVVSTYSDFLDAALATAMGALLIAAALRRQVRVHPAGPILLGVGAVVYLAMPNSTLTAYLVDERLPIAIILAAIAFMTVEIPDRIARRHFVLALLALLAVRVVEVSVNWYELSQQTADVRTSTRLIEPRGARVLVADSDDVSDNEALDFALTHAGCLAIIERSALVSDVFVFPGKQIMDVRAPYSQLAGRTDTEPPSADELAGKHKKTEASRKTRSAEASAPYWRQWQDKYDYVYLMYTDEDQANPAPEVLTLVYQGERFQLYKINKAKH